MDPIYPWLDPIEVRALADQLMRPVKQPPVNVPDAGFDDTFVGFASDPSPTHASPSPFEAVIDPNPPFEAVITAPPAAEPPTPDADPRPQAPPIAESIEESIADDPIPSPLPPRVPFLERIHHFCDWMRHHFSATGIFILDREGAVIFDESNHGRLHFLARSLALASRRPGATAGNVHVKIGAGATLEVIPVETAYGCLVLGAVVPDSMDPTAVAAVMKALSETASPHLGN